LVAKVRLKTRVGRFVGRKNTVEGREGTGDAGDNSPWVEVVVAKVREEELGLGCESGRQVGQQRAWWFGSLLLVCGRKSTDLASRTFATSRLVEVTGSASKR